MYRSGCVCVVCVCVQIEANLVRNAQVSFSSVAIHLVYLRQNILLPGSSPIQLGWQLSYLFSLIFIMSENFKVVWNWSTHHRIAFHLCRVMDAWEAGLEGHVWKGSLVFELPTRVPAQIMKHPDHNESRHHLAPEFRQPGHLCHFRVTKPAS